MNDKQLSALVPPEQTEGAVAWTGSGSLTAVERGDQGFIWPSKEPAHPIPLYARPSPAAAHTAEIARLREALGWVISSPHIAREVARAALKTEASVSPAADVAELCEQLTNGIPMNVIHSPGGDDIRRVPDFESAKDMIREAASALASLSAENAELKRENEKMHELTGLAVTVGGGLSVYGTHDAISRMQDYIMLDSTHPVEKEDVRRSLMRDLKAAEAKLETATATLARMRAALEEIAQQPLSNEAQGDVEDEEIGDFVGGYDLCVQRARTALKGTAS